MKRAAAVLISLMLTATAAQAQPAGMRDGRGGRVDRVAQPGEVAASDIAASLQAQEEGRWRSFKDHGADGAILFAPNPVDAKQWLKDRNEPAGAISWSPHEIWSSCDGSLAVSNGSWTKPDGSAGWYASAWERDRKGEYRWTMEMQGDSAGEGEAPIMIRSHTDGCNIGMRGPRDPDGPPKGESRDEQPHPDIGHPYAISRDGTMRWDVETGADCTRHLTVRFRKDGEWGDAALDRIAASGQGCAN